MLQLEVHRSSLTGREYTQAQFIRPMTAIRTAAEVAASADSPLEPPTSDAAIATRRHSYAPYDRAAHFSCFSRSPITCDYMKLPSSPSPGCTSLFGLHDARHDLTSGNSSTLLIVEPARADALWPGIGMLWCKTCNRRSIIDPEITPRQYEDMARFPTFGQALPLTYSIHIS